MKKGEECMEFKFDYNESTPTIDTYKKLIVEIPLH